MPRGGTTTEKKLAHYGFKTWFIPAGVNSLGCLPAES